MLNTDNCHLLISGHKYEERTLVETEFGKVVMSNYYGRNVSNLCSKADNKLSALTRIITYDPQKRRVLVKVFFESEFNSLNAY